MDDKRFKVYQTEDGFWCIEQMGVRSFLFIGDDEALLVDCVFDGDLKGECEKLTDKNIQE